MKPKVVIEIDTNGNHSVAFCGDVDVYWIDENCPSDRVFKSSNKVDEKIVATALGEAVIGFTGDGSAADARVKKVEAQIEGRPHLEVVPTNKKPH